MRNYADDIKARISMIDVCNQYGIQINHQNKAICPFHADRRPSMHVYEGERGYWCYTCNEGGDIIKFVMRHFSLDFQSACKKLNDDFRLGLPLGGEKLSRSQRIEAGRKSFELRKANEAKKRKREELEANYHKALDEYARLDRMMIDNTPSIESGINDDYAYALQHIDRAKFRLDCAEEALNLYEIDLNRGDKV